MPTVTFISGRFCFAIALQNCGWGWKPGGDDGQADGLAADEGADVLAVEVMGADVLAVEEVGAVGLAGVVLLGVDVGEDDDEEPGELNKFVLLSSISPELVS